MKKLLLVLVMLVSVVFTACNDKKEPNIEEEYRKVVKEYAKQNNFNLEGYEEFLFDVRPHYDASEICEKYDSIFKSGEDYFNHLIETKNSVLYEWIKISDYTPFFIIAKYEAAIGGNLKFLQEDIEWLEFYTSMIDNFYKELEDCNQIIRYGVFWLYNAERNGIKQKYFYCLTIPLLNNLNFDAIECENLMEKDDVQKTLSNFKDDEAIRNTIDTSNINRYYVNLSDSKSLNDVLNDKQFYTSENEKLKAYLEIIK